MVSATATRLTTSNAVPTRPSWLNAAANSSAEASWPADTVADQLADPWSHWKSRAGKEEEAVAGTLADYSHAATPCGHQSHSGNSDRPFALSAVGEKEYYVAVSISVMRAYYYDDLSCT